MKNKKNTSYIFVAIAAALITAIAIYAPSFFAKYYMWKYNKTIPKLAPIPAFQKTDTLLILSPHPDDETLCCSGAILNALSAGAQVYVVWMTAGDGFEWDDILLTHKIKPKPEAMFSLGNRRITESKQAAKKLGIPENHLIYLGFPDRGLIHLFFSNYTIQYTSTFTRYDKVPYSQALAPGTPYTGKNVTDLLMSVMDEVNPTIVLLPAPMDEHPDHKATCFFGLRSLGPKTENVTSFFWIVHGGLEWPIPKDWHPDLYLSPPRSMKSLGWARLDMTKNQIDTKKQAILAYSSQYKALGPYMAAFNRRNEVFIKQSF